MKMHTDKRCKNCSNEDCVWAGHAEHISEKCLGYEPQTNADKIRNMSDEELANVAKNPCDMGFDMGFYVPSKWCKGRNCGSQCTLDWLKQEVSE